MIARDSRAVAEKALSCFPDFISTDKEIQNQSFPICGRGPYALVPAPRFWLDMSAVLAPSPSPALAHPDTSPRKPRRVLPGFGLSLGFTLVYLSLIVLIPLSAVFLKTSTMGWERSGTP